MSKKNTHQTQYHGAETTEEIIGILMAISVLSKRMATKLSLLEQQKPPSKADTTIRTKRIPTPMFHTSSKIVKPYK